MANYEYIFFHTDVPLDELTQQIGDAVQGDAGRDTQGHYCVVRPGRSRGHVGGSLETNVYGPPPDPQPDEFSVLDGYEVVFHIRTFTTNRTEEEQVAEARWLFDDIIAHLPYQVLLTHGMSILVAAWSPTLGLTEFPPKTFVEPEHRDLWAAYDLPTFNPRA
jgi:hypothetical protein